MNKRKNQIVRQNQEDIKRLSILQQETLQFEQQKVQNELAQKLVRLALHQVRENTQRLNSSIHSAVIIFKLYFLQIINHNKLIFFAIFVLSPFSRDSTFLSLSYDH